LPVDRTAITAGASRVASGPLCLHAVATTPAGPIEPCSLVLSHRRRPSPKFRRVGSCIILFEACLAFTHVTACTLAQSPLRPSTPEASAASLPPPLPRLLPGGTNQFPGGTHPLRTSAFSRRTELSGLVQHLKTDFRKVGRSKYGYRRGRGQLAQVVAGGRSRRCSL
jgi:hypothetical protein